MFNFRLLLCLCLLSQFREQVFSQQSYPVKRSEYLEYSNLKELYPQKQQLDNVESGVLAVERFLKYDDLSLIASDSVAAKKTKETLKQIESKEHTLFEIIAINLVTDRKIDFTVNVYLFFEKAHLQMYKGSFKISFDITKRKVLFPLYNPDYNTIKLPAINFTVPRSLSDSYRPNMVKSDAFVSKFINYLKNEYPGFIAPTQKLNYIISDGYFNSLEYFGVQNFFNVSHYTKVNNTIFDLVAKGFYKHELLHYIFSEYPIKKFLDEGLATLFSGGKGRFEVSSLNEWGVIRKRIKSNEQYRAVFDRTDSLFDGAYSHEMYYTSAVLLYKYYLNLGDKRFFTQLFETLVPLSNKDAMTLLKKELNITKLSDFLEATDDNAWISINSSFSRF